MQHTQHTRPPTTHTKPRSLQTECCAATDLKMETSSWLRTAAARAVSIVQWPKPGAAGGQKLFDKNRLTVLITRREGLPHQPPTVSNRAK
jgi:hypothetical protein